MYPFPTVKAHTNRVSSGAAATGVIAASRRPQWRQKLASDLRVSGFGAFGSGAYDSGLTAENVAPPLNYVLLFNAKLSRIVLLWCLFG